MTGTLSILWRSDRERRDLWLSFAASLMAHLAGLGLWVLAAAAMLSLNRALLTDIASAREAALRRAEQQVPTMFVEVDPDLATAEAPPDTPNYSTANSLAANPDPNKDTGTPNIEGREEGPVRTVDVLRPAPEPLVPDPAPPTLQPLEPRPVPETAAPSDPGDLTVGDPTPKPRSPPRTIMEARARQGGMLSGLKSRQDGGVRRRGSLSLDAKASPYGVYDAALIRAIDQRWHDLLEDSALAPRSGRVRVEFTLHQDGRVTDIRVVEQDVGEIFALYCTKAISDPAPYAKWPPEMREAIGKNHRDIRVTFFYL